MWGTKLERFLPKNQHTQMKLQNFENWINGDLRSFQKSEINYSTPIITVEHGPKINKTQFYLLLKPSVVLAFKR